MFKPVLFALTLVVLAGCSSKDKLEVPKDAKPAPTTPVVFMGGGGAEVPKK